MKTDNVREFVVKQINTYTKLKNTTSEEKYFQGMVDALHEVLVKIDNENSFF